MFENLKALRAQIRGEWVEQDGKRYWVTPKWGAKRGKGDYPAAKTRDYSESSYHKCMSDCMKGRKFGNRLQARAAFQYCAQHCRTL